MPPRKGGTFLGFGFSGSMMSLLLVVASLLGAPSFAISSLSRSFSLNDKMVGASTLPERENLDTHSLALQPRVLGFTLAYNVILFP